MSGKTFGKTMNHGFAGSYGRQPDMIINTRANVGADNIVFGSPVMKGTKNTVVGVKNVTDAFTAADFVGVASREIKSALNYTNQNAGGAYVVDEPVPVFERGSINVICKVGTPVLGGKVYVRIVAATGKAIGDFEASADSTNSIELTNAQWGGSPDANGVAELVLLTRVNA